jgi:hypothetical protein
MLQFATSWDAADKSDNKRVGGNRAPGRVRQTLEGGGSLKVSSNSSKSHGLCPFHTAVIGATLWSEGSRDCKGG